jgi:hypothetical protein
MAFNKPRKPKVYDTGADTLLGRFFGSLNASMGEPISPGKRPALTPIDGVDMNALQSEFAPGGYGMKSQIVSDLYKNDPAAFQIFSNEIARQNEWDALKALYDSRVANAEALQSGGMTGAQMRSMLGDWWGDQPFLGKAAGAGLALGNLGGLVDNDKFGGQLGGLALGGLGSYMGGLGPGASALLTMGGGELGALFDKLRAKREGQRRQITQQQQARR